MKKQRFISELRTVIQQAIREELQSSTTPQPKWLRSSQVRDMLNVSDSTLQTLRISGTVPAYKLGTTWLYKLDEINAILEANRTVRKEVRYE